MQGLLLAVLTSHATQRQDSGKMQDQNRESRLVRNARLASPGLMFGTRLAYSLALNKVLVTKRPEATGRCKTLGEEIS